MLTDVESRYVIYLDNTDPDSIRYNLEWHKAHYEKPDSIHFVDDFHSKQSAIDHAVLLSMKSGYPIYFKNDNGSMDLIFNPDANDFEVAFVIIGKTFETIQKDMTLQEAKYLCYQLNQDHGQSNPGHYMVFWKYQ